MKAWRLHDKQKLSLDELPSQSVAENCVKIKTLCSTVSITDMLMYGGEIPLSAPPTILGRQCVGMVTETGEAVTSLTRGDRVVADPFVCCKTCAPCKAGRGDECEKMISYGVNDNGFLSDFTVVPESALYKLPDRITDVDAVFIEHIALSINTINKLNLGKGEYIVIVGANALGLILAQVALYYQAVPVLVDTDADALALAESLGVYYTVNSVESEPIKKIFNLTGGKMAETVAFITTSNMSFGRSLDYAAINGRVALVGWSDLKIIEHTGGFSGILSKQLKVMGVNNGARLFPAAINLLATRTVDVGKLDVKKISFAEVDKVISEPIEGELFIKAVVKV